MNAGIDLDVLIVDDEELARLRLRTLIGECQAPRARVVGETGTVAHALLWLEEHRCDVILLDIQMPGADGMQLAAALRQRAERAGRGQRGMEVPAIVFVTAHAQHALKAFELDATDYLTKPVRRERLQATLTRVAKRIAPMAAAAVTVAPAGAVPVAEAGALPGIDGAATIVVSERGRLTRVPVDDVLYLKAELKYVTLRTATRSHVLDDALNDLEQRLGDGFMRVHRNALVARKAVGALDRRASERTVDRLSDRPADKDDDQSETWSVRVDPVDEWLAVSRRLLTAVREQIAARGV